MSAHAITVPLWLRAIRTVACAVAVAAGCDRAAPTPAPDGATASAPSAAADARVAGSAQTAPPRIVSLSPAITRTLVDLGGGAAVVGRSRWCDAVDSGVPVVGSLDERDLERIAALQPTLVLVQASAPDAALEQLARDRGFVVQARHLNSLEDVRALVHDLGASLEAIGIAGAQRRAEALLQAHAQALAERPVPEAPTLLLFGTDPPSAFGRGTYPDELWRAMGGVNAITVPGYPALSVEDVARLAPALTIVIGSAPPPEWLARATGGRVVALNAPALLEPSTRMLQEGPSALRSAAGPRTGADAGVGP